jgi:hypothetical protein
MNDRMMKTKMFKRVDSIIKEQEKRMMIDRLRYTTEPVDPLYTSLPRRGISLGLCRTRGILDG